MGNPNPDSLRAYTTTHIRVSLKLTPVLTAAFARRTRQRRGKCTAYVRTSVLLHCHVRNSCILNGFTPNTVTPINSTFCAHPSAQRLAAQSVPRLEGGSYLRLIEVNQTARSGRHQGSSFSAGYAVQIRQLSRSQVPGRTTSVSRNSWRQSWRLSVGCFSSSLLYSSLRVLEVP